ncbi:MAG: D-alanyl-D-alanine carboxypeptidase family protein [Pseudomonadota bacterium]|nr:D-alanyl-D-alanine carboxypeptidase family protein [Pseudomonadota bacterium]
MVFKIFRHFYENLTQIILLLVFLSIPSDLLANKITTKARQAILFDMNTGTVLMEKSADERMAPASMSKLMTAYMVFEKLKADHLSLDDTFPVSSRAWKKGGSKMFVMVNTRVKVSDLLRGIIVQSGNDACIVLAEGLSGSEEAFSEEMNNRAKVLGLTNSYFENATGWPSKSHYMSARDIIILSTKIIQQFPDYYKFFAEKNFSFGGIKQGNRNPLLYRDFGADGLKTGYTRASGYGLVVSAIRDQRRLLLVLNGLSSKQERSSEASRFLEWGFRSTAIYPIFKKGEVIDQGNVWLGKERKISIAVPENVVLSMPRKSRRELKLRLLYKDPIPAPINIGSKVGTMIITAPGIKERKFSVVAGSNVEKLGGIRRLTHNLKYVLWGTSKK